MGRISHQDLEQIRETQDVAAWYRPLSISQIDGLLYLTNAIRDDRAQSSTFRVRGCLVALGIEPMIGKKCLKKLITCCQGSNLALLYFLLIGYYKRQHKTNVYTYNEQVLMSCIMELDLEMTLNALDQILPTGHTNPKDLGRLCKNNEQKERLQKRCNQKGKNILPYFSRQPRPKPYGKPLTSTRPDVVVSFPFWPAGKKAVYTLDANRWFSSYKLQPIRRLAHRLISDIIDNYCSKCSRKEEVTKETKLCATHRAALDQKQAVKDELIVKSYYHCLELFDVDARANQKRRERIVTQLDTDIENYTRRLQKLDQIQYTKVGLLKDCSLCKLDSVITRGQDAKTKSIFDVYDVARLKQATNSAVCKITGENHMEIVSDLETDQAAEEETVCEGGKEYKDLPSCPSTKLPRVAFIKESKSKQSRKPHFFTAAQPHKPFAFNYQRIFQPLPAQPMETIQVIHQEAIRTLTDRKQNSSVSSFEDCENSYSQLQLNRDDVIKAIVKCAESMWTNSINIYNQNQKSKGEDEPTRSCLQYNQTYFNPDDSQLMERLLCDGINMLRCDPNFILPTFPDVHKTTVLREWIKRRYGKTYRHHEIVTKQKRSNKIFQTIASLHNREPPPFNMKQFDVGNLTYQDRNRIFKKANEMKAQYYRGLNGKLMQFTAISWSAMGAEFRKDDNLKNVFYSYLPARNIEITRINPWKFDLKSMKKVNRIGK
ncbi:uncharacterized protein [Drosophila tropicalis]|uniref:uncharacterized protein n=1 Tax=Drosophila tropicalis TaxID=46794 RepID=UPI0035AC0508